MSKVTLRRKEIGKGRSSLFLDMYPPVVHPDTGILTRKHYLKIYLYNKPKTELERAHNRETIELAETIRARRQLEVQNRRFDFLSSRMLNGDFISFFEDQKAKRKTGNAENWRMSVNYFKSFAGEKLLFPQINETFCEEYADYLLSAPGIGRRGRKISKNTAVSYFAKFRATLKEAYRKGFLASNLGEIVESISPKDTHREFLFLDELQNLTDTPCKSEVVRKASLFSALTGLRFSDIHSLEWRELRGSVGNYFIQFSTDKTGSAEFLPISDQAYELLGEKGDGKVFKGLKYHNVDNILPDWLKTAGIDKHITFHCFRHTFATLQLVLGTDIVTVSKLLGHRDIKTTMIYVKIVDKLKRDASHRIKLDFGKNWLSVAKLAQA